MISRQPLPCIACGVQPDPAFPDDEGTYQPWGATMFRSRGHYGSTVWDPMGGDYSLLITVCDKCLDERRDRAIVEHVLRRDPDVEYTPWTRDDDD